MIATYIVGGVGLFLATNQLFAGNPEAAADWAAALAVGGAGLLSFVRHSILHRSDAARMGWDLGRRNDFQIEVGFANLAWGLVGLAAWALGWGVQAEGSVILVFGIYMVLATLLHVAELLKPASEGGHRWGPAVGSAVFAALLVVVGVGVLV